MIWKNVIGFEDLYEVSDYGIVRKKETKEEIKIATHKGNKIVNLQKNNIENQKQISRLVIQSHTGVVRKSKVLRKDGDKNNNKLDNLYYESRISMKEKSRRRTDRRKKDIIMYYCEQMSNNARSRIFSPSRKNRKIYSELENGFGFKKTQELRMYLYENFKDTINEILQKKELPSIDRINTNMGYIIGNIRVISFKENTLLGVESRKRKVFLKTKDGKEYIFNSVTDCADFFGNKKSCSKISSWIKKDGRYKINESILEIKYI